MVGDEKAVPEWWIVKREILWADYEAAKALARFWRNHERGVTDRTAKLEFIKNVSQLYITLRAKLKKKNTLYKDIDNFLLEGKSPTFKRWVQMYFDLVDYLDELGITKIERKSLPPEMAVLEGYE